MSCIYFKFSNILSLFFAFSALQDPTFGRRSSGVRVSPLRLFIARHRGVKIRRDIGRETIASSFAASITLLWFGYLSSCDCELCGRRGVRGSRAYYDIYLVQIFFSNFRILCYEKIFYVNVFNLFDFVYSNNGF